MSLPQNLGRLSAALTSDASLNIGVGVTPSGSFKLEVGTTSKFTGVATFGSTLSNGTYSYTLPGATGTLALVGGAGVGTVTSVAAITLGTSGTDLSSTVANSTTTPVITLQVPTASATNRGALSSADWTTFNNKQSALTNPVTGTGTSGQVAYFNGTSSITSNAAFAFTPTSQLLVNNSVTAASAIARGTNLTPTLTAAANSDILVGLDINPTFTNGAFTGVTNTALRVGPVANAYISSLNQSRFGFTTDALTFGQNGFNISTNAAGSIQRPNNASRMVLGTANIAGLQPGYLFALDSFQKDAGLIYDRNSSWIALVNGTASDNSTTYTPRLTVQQNGNVGINTTTDAGYKLDVNGTGRFTGALSGTSATFSGNGSSFGSASAGSYPLTIQTNISEQSIKFIGKNDNNNVQFFASNGSTYQAVLGTIGTDFIIGTGTSGTTRLTIASTGTATFSSSIVGTGGVMSLQKNGSGTVGSGAYYTLYNTATTDGVLWQLNASNNIDFWGLTSNSFTASPVITLTRAGAATFSSSVTVGTDIVLSAANPFVYGGTSVGAVGMSNISGSSYMKIYAASHATLPNLTQFVNNGSTSLTIASTGNTTITGSDRVLELRGAGGGANSLMRISDATTAKFSVGLNNGNYIIYDDANGAYRFVISAAGLVTITSLGTGTVQATAGVLSVISDSKAKDKTGLFQGSALIAINKIEKPQYWNYNDKSELGETTYSVKQFGLFADDIHEVLGEEFAPTQTKSVYNEETKETKVEPILIDGSISYSMSDRALLSLAIQAIQELKAEIDLLKGEPIIPTDNNLE